MLDIKEQAGVSVLLINAYKGRQQTSGLKLSISWQGVKHPQCWGQCPALAPGQLGLEAYLSGSLASNSYSLRDQ